jgi:hypothetical protein
MFVRACSRRIHAISLGISRLGQVSAARILEEIEGFLNNLENDANRFRIWPPTRLLWSHFATGSEPIAA